MTGDGVDNLVVLAETADRRQRIFSVWYWHGWSYMLLWHNPSAFQHALAALYGMSYTPKKKG